MVLKSLKLTLFTRGGAAKVSIVKIKAKSCDEALKEFSQQPGKSMKDIDDARRIIETLRATEGDDQDPVDTVEKAFGGEPIQALRDIPERREDEKVTAKDSKLSKCGSIASILSFFMQYLK